MSADRKISNKLVKDATGQPSMHNSLHVLSAPVVTVVNNFGHKIFTKMLKKNRIVATSGVVLVLIILSVLKVVVNWPTQLYIFFVATFLFISVVFWFWKQPAKVGGKQIALWLNAWLLPAGLFLAVLYHVDRAGWNWHRITGYDVTISEDFTEEATFSIEMFLQKHSAFKRAADNSNIVYLSRGTYHVSETIVIPGGIDLRIEPGVTLKFSAGCSLISYGSITAIGTESAPIRFAASNPFFKWGSIGVVKAGPSRFHHVHFEHGRWATVNNINFVAGLTLFDTDVELKNCRFENMFGKDAVNVRNANAVVAENIFKNAYKDGIDMDGGSGVIRDNKFINCQDEGIDLSENHGIQVFGNSVKDAFGGRIAADNELEEVRAGNELSHLVYQ